MRRDAYDKLRKGLLPVYDPTACSAPDRALHNAISRFATVLAALRNSTTTNADLQRVFAAIRVEQKQVVTTAQNDKLATAISAYRGY